MREESGTTQEEFAVKTNVPLSTLRKWEQGVITPNKAVLRLIHYALEQQGQDLEKIWNDLGVV